VRGIVLAVAIAALVPVGAARAQTAADSAGIRQAALDYIDGYWEGNAERMERTLHPDLAKRIVRTAPSGQSGLQQMSAMTLVQITRAGGGRNVPAAQRRSDVRILDIYYNAASVRIDAGLWVDYLQVGKWNGQWKIVNVLWEMPPQPTPPQSPR